MYSCTLCNKIAKNNGWFLENYFGISGYFCSECYVKVRHDPYGNPCDPQGYLMALLKLDFKNY